MNQKITKIDIFIINKCKKLLFPFSRFAIFIVYFWFGILKVFSLSPANPLVAVLLENTLRGVSFDTFIVAFGVFEMIIAIVFIMPKLARLAIFLLFLHLITTFMPLVFVPMATWQSFMVPTIEGQYIIKNLLIIAVAILISSNLNSFKENKC
jgi:uncharacterized membrane protein YkgB